MATGEFGNWIDLSCHPSGLTRVVRSIRSRVQRSGARIRVSYRLEADPERILVPAPGVPAIGIELWRHTCFEAFVKREGTAEYHEFNFAPSKGWTVYAFSAYRKGAPLSDESMNPEIAVRSDPSYLQVDAVIQLARLSNSHPHAALCLGLAAVIETTAGFSYWALHHPAAKPDFHHPESFVLRLEP